MTKTKKQKSAFTLIEMLVVIAIIGILTALMITSFSRSQKNAKDTRRMSNVENVRGSLSMYYSMKGTWPTMDNWSTMMNSLVSAQLIDNVSNQEDGSTVYTLCNCTTCNCTGAPNYGLYRICATCLLEGTQCANTDTGGPAGNDSYCVFIK